MVATQEGVKEFTELADRMTKTIERLQSRGEAQSDIYFWEALRNYYQRAAEARQQGKTVVMTGMFPPHEIFHAMDIPFYVAENHAIMTYQGNPELGEKLFDTAEQLGMPTDVCSPHRVAMAIAKIGMGVRPDFVVSTSTTCDQTLKLYELLADFYGVPSFMVDNPYRIDEAGLAYARQDVQDLISFVEQQTGKKMDYDRLKEVLRLSREMYDWWEKLCELRTAVPSPMRGRAGIKDLTLILTSSGTEVGVNYFKARYQETKEKVDRKEGALPNEERYRVAWLYVLPLFDMRVADWMEDQFGAVITVDSFGYAAEGIDLNPEDPLDFLAKKPLKRGFVCRGWSANEDSQFAADLRRVVEKHHANVAILLAHWSCQQYCGTIPLLRDQIGKGLGLPFCILPGDLLDARVVSSEQMRSHLWDFFTSVVGATPTKS